MPLNGPFKFQEVTGDRKKTIILNNALENLIWHGNLNNDLIKIQSSPSPLLSSLNPDDSIDLKTHQHFMYIEERYLNSGNRSRHIRNIYHIGKKYASIIIEKNTAFILLVIFVLILIVIRGKDPPSFQIFFDYGAFVYKLLRFTIISALLWLLSIVLSSLSKFSATTITGTSTIISATASTSTTSVIVNVPSTFTGYLKDKLFRTAEYKIHKMFVASISFSFIRMFVNLDSIVLIFMISLCCIVYNIIEYMMINRNMNHELINHITSLSEHIVAFSNREYMTEITLREHIICKIINKNDQKNSNNNTDKNDNDLIYIQSHMKFNDFENDFATERENKVRGILKDLWTLVVQKIVTNGKIQSQATIIAGNEVTLFLK